RALPAEVDVGARHAPQLEAAGPADLVKLEVRPIPRIPEMPAPDLHRRARIADQGGYGSPGSGLRDPVRLIWRPHDRALGLGRRFWSIDIEPLGPQRHFPVAPERVARLGEVGIGEEVAKAGRAEVLLDAGTRSRPRPVGAFGHPAARGVASEQAPMLAAAHGQLQANALVACQE